MSSHRGKAVVPSHLIVVLVDSDDDDHCLHHHRLADREQGQIQNGVDRCYSSGLSVRHFDDYFGVHCGDHDELGSRGSVEIDMLGIPG